MTTRPTITPALRYQDAPAAIEFLCKAFGFERHAVYADPDDPSIIHHAQLTYGNGMIMLGSARDDETKARYRWKTAEEAGGITACLCLIVDDIEAHHARAVAGGAEIVTPLHDNQGYPGRSYNARDPEGNDWDFGNYDPWA